MGVYAGVCNDPSLPPVCCLAVHCPLPTHLPCQPKLDYMRGMGLATPCAAPCS